MRQLLLALALSAAVLADTATVGAAPASAPMAFVQHAAPGAFEATPVTFGLTPAQTAAIRSLTGGAVDLGGYQRTRLAPRSAKKAPQGYRGPAGDTTPPFAGAAFGESGAPDPALASEWWLDELRVRGAWSLATGRGVTIADCDTGFYTDEADLSANLRLDLRRDLSDSQDPANVSDGRFTFHGTAVAAIMSGVRDGRGTNGIAFDSKLVPLQNYNYDEAVDDLDKEEATARCVLHALTIDEVGVIVVQNQTSRGSSETFAGTRDAIRLALRAGVAVVAAAGNASLELTAEAADDTGSIIVGALRRDGRAANFSNFGWRVTIGAFGENLRTLYGPDGRLDAFGGTTGAAAQVGATVALMREVGPLLTPQQLRRILIATRRVTADNARVGGRLDVEAAVRAAQAAVPEAAAGERQQRFRGDLKRILTDGAGGVQ